MIYFTGDLHLGHERIITTSSRSVFQTIENMNTKLINNWNSTLKDNDEIWILGDMFYRTDKETIISMLSCLKGHKRLIVGNHDHEWLESFTKDEINHYFDYVGDMGYIKINKKHITLCHYPLLEYSGSRYDNGGIQIHGHIHDNKQSVAYDVIRISLIRSYNAGVDINGYRPVSLNELIKNNDQFYGRISI